MKQPKSPQRGSQFLWRLFLGIVAIAVVVILVNQEAGMTLGIPDADLARLVFLVALLMFVGAGLLGRRLNLGEVVRSAAAWLAIILVAVGLYAYRDEVMGVGGRLLSVLAPGVPISGRLAGSGDPDSVVVVRSSDGHFAVRTTIDDKPLLLLVDTGASFVTLTYEEAEALGIDPASLQFRLSIRTANGTIRAAPIKLGKVTVGTIERVDVSALVAPKGALEQGLLGMTFLDTLDGYSISGDRLVMTP